MLIIIMIIFLVIITVIVVSHFRLVDQYKKAFENERDQKNKMTEFYDILIRWMELYQEEKKISNWIQKYGYKRVAVYGMRELGVLVYNELLLEKVDVVCAIDKNSVSLNLDIDVIKPCDELPDIDVIIVTAPHYYGQIKRDLENITQASIVSIEDIIFEL